MRPVLPGRRLLSRATAVLPILYPLAVYAGLTRLDVRPIAAALLALFALRALCMPQDLRLRTWGLTAVGGALALAAYGTDDAAYLRLYPALMSAAMLAIFGASLFFPPTVVETLARLRAPKEKFPPHALAYMRSVTKLWCAFFVFNGLIAAYTVRYSLEIWTLYNGLISYLLTGALFAAEFVYRSCIVKKRNPRADG
jgi:uncharacterized membrane protein